MRSESNPSDGRRPPGRPVRALTAVGAIGALLMTAPAVAADDTPWAGWSAQGPPGAPFGLSSVDAVRVTAAGPTVFATWGPAFTATDGSHRVTGALPAGTDATPPAVAAVLPSGRIVVAGRSSIARSDDLGRRWRVTDLGAATADALGDGRRTGPVFVDDRRGVVLVDTPPVAYGSTPLPAERRTGPATLATEDGGVTWTVRRAKEGASPTTRSSSDRATPRTSDPGPPPPASRIVAAWVVPLPGGGLLRAVLGRFPESAVAVIERSTDLGASWETVPVPLGPATTSPLPTVRPAGVTASGAVVVPVDDVLQVSTDGLRTFTRVVPPGREPKVLCDPDGSCLVDVLDPARAGRRAAATFDGTTFGPTQPALPGGAVAPAPGLLLGTRRSADGSTDVVRSTDGGRSETSTGLFAGARVIAGGDPAAMVARQVGGTLQVSRDGVAWSTIPAPPTASQPLRVAAAPGGVALLTLDQRVWRWRFGAWSSWSAASIGPTDLVATDAGVVVIGTRGILRRADGRVARTLRLHDGELRGASGPRLRTSDGLSGVSAKGRLVIAWTGDDDRYGGPADGVVKGGIVRSLDGGRTWRHLPGARRTDDLQIASGRVVFRTYGSGLYVSRDAGQRFRLVNRVDGFGLLDRADVAFSDARRGTVGTSVTTDGGRTLSPVPAAPGDPLLRVAGAGVLTSGVFESPLRSPALADMVRPRIVLRLGRPARPGERGERSIPVSGRLTGVPAGTAVPLVAARGLLAPRGSRSPDGPLVTDAGGRFRGTVTLGRGDRLLRVQTPALVTAERTVLGTRSAWARVPR